MSTNGLMDISGIKSEINFLNKLNTVLAYFGYLFTAVIVYFLIKFGIDWAVFATFMLLISPVYIGILAPAMHIHLTTSQADHENYVKYREYQEQVYNSSEELRADSGFWEYKFVHEGITVSVPRSKFIGENFYHRIYSYFVIQENGHRDPYDYRGRQSNLIMLLVDQRLNLPFLVQISRDGKSDAKYCLLPNDNPNKPDAAKGVISYWVFGSADEFASSVMEICPDKFDDIDFDSYTYFGELRGNREMMKLSHEMN